MMDIIITIGVFYVWLFNFDNSMYDEHVVHFVYDDIVNELVRKFEECDGLVIGSPVYYSSANGTLISLLDRLFYSGGRKMVGKVGAAVVSCRRGGASASLDRLNKYFTIAQMPVVSSKYWNMVHGNTPEQVKQDLEGMQVMRYLGRNMAWMLKCREESGIEPFEREVRVKTSFYKPEA